MLSRSQARVRKSFVIALAGAVLATLVGASGLLRPAEQASAATDSTPGLAIGLHQDLTWDGYAWRRAQALGLATSVHAEVSRSSLLWHLVEPTQGTRDWSRVDAVVDEVSAAGMQLVFTAYGSPSWANGVPESTSDSWGYVPTGAAFNTWKDRYVDFVREAARRYRGRNIKWEIWNEENEHYFWKPAPNVRPWRQETPGTTPVATPAEWPNPPFPDDIAGEIGKQLQLTLVELIALSLTGKQLHWSAYGREFLSAHRHLDQLVDEWRELEEAVAQRAAAIGIPPDGSAAAVIELADTRPLEPGFIEVGCAIECLCTQLWDVALRVRTRSALLGALDAFSQDVLVDVGRKLEEQLWLMRAQLPD